MSEIPNILPILTGNINNKIQIQTTPISYNHHDVFLDSEITEPSEYRDLITLLFNAGPDDEINLYINSGGGSLYTGLAIIEGLKNTAATVTAILLGECHSAASIIALHCNEIAVLDSAHIMVHTANFGTIGTTNNVKAHTDFIVNKVEKLIDETYSGFLTEEEIKKVKDGSEYWFDAEEIKARLIKKAEYVNKAQEQETNVTKKRKTK